MRHQLEKFLISPARYAELVQPPTSAMFRKSMRLHNDRRLITLDLVQVLVEFNKRRKGALTTLILQMEQVAAQHGYEAVLVECVHHVWMQRWLLRYGYELQPYHYPANLIKVL